MEEEQAPEDLTIPRRRRLELQGHTLSFLSCGPASGQPVILLHGFPTSAEIWRPFQARLARQGYRTLAPDLPSMGKTLCKTKGIASWQASIELIRAWLRVDQSLKNIWWCGHQLGALLAVSCAEEFIKRTDRCTVIQPILSKNDLWPEPVLKSFALGLKLGLFDFLAKHGWLEKYILARRLAESPLSHFDRYLHRRLICNEKVTDPERRGEFISFFKSLPPDITQQTIERLQKLPIPRQVILDGESEQTEWELLTSLVLRLIGKPRPVSPHFILLNQISRQPTLELISLKATSPYLPLVMPSSSAEATLLWAKRDMHELLIAAYQEANKRPDPPPAVEQPEIRINPALSLPPDGKPEHVQKKAAAKKPVARPRARTK